MIELQGLDCRVYIDKGNLVVKCNIPLEEIPGKIVTNVEVPTINDVTKILEQQGLGERLRTKATKQYTRIFSSGSSRSIFVIQEQKDSLLLGITKELTGNTDAFIYLNEVSYEIEDKKLSSKYSFLYSPSHSRINLIQEIDRYTNGNFKKRNMKYIHELYAYQRMFPLGNDEMPKHFPIDLREIDMESIDEISLRRQKRGVVGHDSDGNPIFDFLGENAITDEESNRILISLPYSEDSLFWEIFQDFPDDLTYMIHFGGSPDDETISQRRILENFLENLSPVNYEDLHEQISEKNLGIYSSQDTRFPHVINFKFSNKKILETFFDDLSKQLENIF
jgi:hypothetical protein